MIKIENWKTASGPQVRVVERAKDGKFVNNKSARQLLKSLSK